jgi:DNA-binding beta-propeller fold protein YncE
MFILITVVILGGATENAYVPVVHACAECRFLLSWGSEGSGNGEFSIPNGVAVQSSGNVYVTDYGNNRVQEFTSTGTYVTQWGSGGVGTGEFNGPAGVAVDSAGNVYVADFYNDRVEKFTSSGTFITAWGCAAASTSACTDSSANGQFTNPSGIAVDSSGNVYVTDIGNNRVEKFAGTGGYVAQWGSLGSANGQFNGTTGIAVDSTGNVYVADFGNNRIQKFTAAGTYVTQWGSSGSGQGEFSGPFAVAVDPSGNVYVSDEANDRVQEFTSTGSFVTQYGSYGSGSGQFEGPLGVAVDAFGTVYVTDWLNDRVEMFGDVTLVSLSLVAGWNLISLPIIPVNERISYVLAGLIAANNFTTIWAYQSGKWSEAVLSGGNLAGPLTTMQDGLGYWIYSTRPSTLCVMGWVIPPSSAPPTYTLVQGWNLVGYKPEPSVTNETLGTYLSSISGKYDANNVWVYDDTGQSWVRASSSYMLQPGQAMWIMITGLSTLRP